MNVTTTDEEPREGTLFQIGEVAERVGLSLRTVRYYEEMGLVAPAKRTTGGFRLYGEDQVDRLVLITQMKPLGFTVPEMGELLDALEQQADRGAGKKAREAAAGRVREFAQTAEERCERLRAQLASGEDLVKQLADDSARPNAAASGH